MVHLFQAKAIRLLLNALVMNAVFFDGTSYFVDSVNLTVDSDTEIVFKSNSIDLCKDKCDTLNDEAY